MIITYTFRSSALEKEKTLELTPEAIIIHTPDKTDSVPLTSIQSVRLYYDPSGYAANKYQCDITLQNGAKLLIKSVHYVAPAIFEDRKQAYRDFIEALHRQLAPYEGIRYQAGNQPGYFGLNMLTVLLSVIFVGIALFSFGASAGNWIIVKSIFFIGLVYGALVYLKRNRPGSYRPQQLPKKVLPD